MIPRMYEILGMNKSRNLALTLELHVWDTDAKSHSKGFGSSGS